jgi:hypothetical protein
VREDQRHHHRAGRRRRAQHAEPLGPHAQHLVGEHGQERRRAAEEHREQVERHGAEDHRLGAHELHALDEAARHGKLLGGARAAARSGCGRTPANAASARP